ncbi:MFS multidrug transporter, putative [Talaromyces stipitatus ATCC 10500]|uniref:MFS multidrug transporter, putative n=1 Tax=Talaromyces stipitatus (strain ATCC 10500 / CBS 375.48 / QM 6759 / NRRL 1006) TaxID=441959 RepID=B8M3A5_TALSN|nr:MFS multidrug transporter, putative [Talaromyces stipitatus ATCC 10500]EED22277.1 MFS multidrug transporter, putative [Talaromyces stipitatus ATCC 10500]
MPTQQHRLPVIDTAKRWLQRLVRSQNNSNDVPFPWQQFTVLALVRICEPIAFMSVFPYAYYMVESFHVAESEEKIALFVGMITSAFTFAEFSSGVFWGRLSDKIGRKPVLIMGLIGTAISMLVFGFAPNFPTAMVARALGGLLNGNIGVLQTTVAELVTSKEQQPRAYSIMPFIWCLGSIIGPYLGGALARPVLSYPAIFKPGTIFDRFPFLLPNLVCIGILIIGITIGTLFLEETHVEKKHRRDRGVELGRWLLGRSWSGHEEVIEPMETKIGLIKEMESDEIYEDQPPEYRSREPSPRSSSIGNVRPPEIDLDLEEPKRSRRVGFKNALTKPVVCVIVGYGILAYHSVSFDQLMPIFLSTPPSEKDIDLPLKFTGGLALSTKTIGYMLAVQGIYSLFAQIFLFPFLVNQLGALRSLRLAMFIWPPIYFAVPYLILLPSTLQKPAAYVALLSKITLHVICFPGISLLLANTIPSKNVMGTVNGLASSVASLSRALGPSITGLLHSQGLRSGYSIIAWWALGIVCVIGAIESLFMEETDQKQEHDIKTDTTSEQIPSVCQHQQSLYPEPLVVSEEVGLLSNMFTTSEISEPLEMSIDDKSERP